jgi:hypothetical protein
MDGFTYYRALIALVGTVITASFPTPRHRFQINDLQHHITIIIYNLYFHPLSKFPGPRLWAAFQFPYLYTMLQGVVPYRIKSFHDQYGLVVRISPNELSFIDLLAWKDIYLNKDFIRPKQWDSRPPNITAYSVISAPVEVHARFRNALGASFSERTIKAQEPLIKGYVNILMTKLRVKIEESEKGKAGVDIVE